MDTKKIAEIIENALLVEGYDEVKAYDIAFHMTDWRGDLEQLHNFFLRPGSFSTKAIEGLILGFLIHVPNHLAAASKLLLDVGVTDVFGVGAIGDTEEEE